MKFAFRFPYQRMTWLSTLNVSEARKALATQVGEGRAPGTTFRGKLDGNTFEIARVVNYRNGFLPKIFGEFQEAPGGRTQVSLVMRPGLPTLIFMAIWLSGIVSVVSRAALEGIQGAGQGIWFVGPIFAFGVALMGFAFGTEAKEAERQLRALLPEGRTR